MNRITDDLIFIAEAFLLAVLGCLLLQAIAMWFTPVGPHQVKGYEYPLSAPLRAVWCKTHTECSLMAENLVYEARSESEKGAVAVAYVVLQRAEAKRWPDTIRGVIMHKCDFSWTCQKPQRKITEKDWTRAYEISYNVLHGKVENPFPGADHYYNPRKVKRVPHWARVYKLVGVVDQHRFYKSKEGV